MSLHSSTLRFGTALGALVGGGLLALGGYDLLGVGLAVVGFSGVACAWLSLRGGSVSSRTRFASAVE
jgi:predicted MFS family arabinose efflux permease